MLNRELTIKTSKKLRAIATQINVYENFDCVWKRLESVRPCCESEHIEDFFTGYEYVTSGFEAFEKERELASRFVNKFFFFKEIYKKNHKEPVFSL